MITDRAQDKGRKRHIATDTLGLLLVVLVTAASVQDTVGGRDVVGELAARHPAVVKVWADSGYQRSVIEQGAAHGIDVEVVRKDPGQKGFAPLPKRWAVERTFGWWALHRRLVRDYETLPQRSQTMIYWTMIDNMSRRLTADHDDRASEDPSPPLLHQDQPLLMARPRPHNPAAPHSPARPASAQRATARQRRRLPWSGGGRVGL